MCVQHCAQKEPLSRCMILLTGACGFPQSPFNSDSCRRPNSCASDENLFTLHKQPKYVYTFEAVSQVSEGDSA